MDPVTIAALITAAGAAGGAGLSFFGGQSAQAQQQAAASGAYLPQLVANANKAGISPLAVMGYHAPSVGNVIPGDLAAGGLAAGAKALAGAVDPHTQTMQRIQEDLGQSQIAKAQAEISATKVGLARDMMIQTWLSKHPEVNPFSGNLDVPGTGYDVLKTMGQGVQSGIKYLSGWLGSTGWDNPYNRAVTDALGR